MKIEIMKPILFSFFLLNILFSINIDFHNTLELINHAKTYHWLGRYKYNDSEEFKIAKEYFNKALTSLDKIEQSEKKEILYNQIISGIKELDIRYENNFDNINNIYPLYNILSGFTNTYEFFDDSDADTVSDFETFDFPILHLRRSVNNPRRHWTIFILKRSMRGIVVIFLDLVDELEDIFCFILFL